MRDNPAMGDSEEKPSLASLLSRVLDHLAITAIIPALAMTFLGFFVVQIGHALNQTEFPGDRVSPDVAVSVATDEMANGGAAQSYLLAGVVALIVVLTQVFATSVLAVLEGKWGRSPVAEWAADLSCAIQLRHRKRLSARRRRLRQLAWDEAWANLLADGSVQEIEEPKRGEAKQPLTREQRVGLAYKMQYDEKNWSAEVTWEDTETAAAWPWEEEAPAKWLRRIEHVEARWSEFPWRPKDTRPTRLGNLLRSFEERLPSESLSPGANLPKPLAKRGESLRAQMDMYGLFFAEWLVLGVICLVQLSPSPYLTVVSTVICVLLAAVSYQALIVTARQYGANLVATSEALNPQR